jgi:MOSC domain-containing protein YiiM
MSPIISSINYNNLSKIMSEVYKLGISINNNQPINEVNSIDVIKNQGVVGDRHFKEFNDPYNQLSLIESENIDYYNIKYGVNIPYLDFRRNVVTKGIQLNDLVGKKILVGECRS